MIDGARARDPLGHAAALGVSVAIHGLMVLLAVAWGEADSPKPPRPVVFVETRMLVRKGRLPTEREKKLLPRLSSAPEPTKDAVHLGKVKPKPKEEPPKPKKDRAREQEDRKRKRAEERRRRRKLMEALRSITKDRKTAKSVDDLPIGRPDGSELGTAQEGALKASYVHTIGAALRQEWKVSFLSEEELAKLKGKVKVTVDSTGTILSYSWVKPSPNPDFNSSVEACLERFTRAGTKRLPPFPDDRVFGDRFTCILVFKK